MIVGAAGTDEANVQSLGDFSGFDVEIIKHFDVIADKADRCDDDFVASFARYFSNGLADVRLQPRIARSAAATLVGERPTVTIELARDQTGSFFELLHIR